MGFFSTKMSTLLRGGKQIKVESDDNIISRPFGKWIHLDKNLKDISPKGIYRGDEKEWNRCILQKPVKDFITNQEPNLTFGQRVGDWFGVCCACSQPAPQMDKYAMYQQEIKRTSKGKDIKKIGKM